MDVSSINTGIENLAGVPNQGLSESRGSQAVEKAVEDDALKVNISEVYQKQRDELSQSFKSLNEGISYTSIASKGLEEQTKAIDNVIQILDNANLEETSAQDIKNSISVELQEFDDIAESTTFKDQKILLKDQQDENLNIVTKNSEHTIEPANTKNSSTKLVQNINSNALSTPEDIQSARDIAVSVKDELVNLQDNFQNLNQQIESNAREVISEQINLSKDNAKTNGINFATETADFSQANITTNIGNLVSSQANIVQEQSVRLLK